MGAILSWTIIVAGLPLLTFLAFYLHFKLVDSKHWAKKNIPFAKPIFLLGSMWKGSTMENFALTMEKFHLEHKEKKAMGFWLFTKPHLMVMDLNLTKKILISDFNAFRDRGMELNEDLDPLSAHLFSLSGKKWRNLRVKLTPTFTSGKMKLMFPIMIKNGEELQKHLKTSAENGEPVEVKDLMARFTTDVISSCAFGLEINSMENPDTEFRRFGRKIFEPDWKMTIINIFVFLYPKIAKIFSLRFVPKDVSDFFIRVVRETVEYREKNNVTRNDFLQLLIQLIRAGKIEDADRNPINGEGLDDETLVQKFSLMDAAAQCFVFLGGGFETTSATLTLSLYELALNPDIQRKLQEEIDEKIGKKGLTYEAMMEMEYLDMVVQESLRKHPPVASLQRISTVDYHIPELNATLDKGTLVFFAVRGFHYDPEIYPDPERFDPERFSPEEKRRRETVAYLPFGEGPRNCIGNRFALMQVKAGLIHVLKMFNVEVAETTPIPLTIDVKSFIPIPKRLPLSFKKRN